jgi:hypothetical protein
VILTVYVVKLAHFDAAVSEASLGSVHPVVRGGLAADVWTLAHAPLALALVVLGAVVKRSFSIMKISVQDCNIYNFSLVVVLLSGATIFGSWGSKGERGWLRKRVRVGTRIVGAAGILIYTLLVTYPRDLELEQQEGGVGGDGTVGGGMVDLPKFVKSCSYAPILAVFALVVGGDVALERSGGLNE